MIEVAADAVLDVLDRRGWMKGQFGDPAGEGPVCLHGAIRICQPVAGDAYLIEQVAQRQGWGTVANDWDKTTEEDVRRWVVEHRHVSDEDLQDTLGLQWRAVVALVRRAATLTEDEVRHLGDAWDAARDDNVYAFDDAWRAGVHAARSDAWDGAWDATRGASAWDAARGGASPRRARATAEDAAVAVVVWDIAAADNPYCWTAEARDLLIGPWRDVFGLPDGLIEAVV